MAKNRELLTMIVRSAIVFLGCYLAVSPVIAQSPSESRMGRRTLLPRTPLPRSAAEAANAPRLQPAREYPPTQAANAGQRSTSNATPDATAPRGGLFPLLRRNARQEPAPQRSASNAPNAGDTASRTATNSKRPTTTAVAPTGAGNTRSATNANQPVNGNPFNQNLNAWAGSPSSLNSNVSRATAIAPATAGQLGAQQAMAIAPPIAIEPTGGEKYFDQAVEAIQRGNFDQALRATNVGNVRYPSDVAIKELRGLILFAQHDFIASAEAVREALIAGGGWDWQVFVEIYGPSNVSMYTTQLRTLETAVSETPSSAPLRFLLAYHYQAAGHTTQAERQLKQVVYLDPRDLLARDLLGMPPLPPAPSSEAPSSDVETLPAPPVETLAAPNPQP